MGMGIYLKEMQARVRRLEQLALGLAREDDIWKEVDHPLTATEVKEYREAIYNASSALSKARKALALACTRLEGLR
jgi:hypothetical protein